MQFEVVFEGQVLDGYGDVIDPELLEEHLDRVMAELLAVDAVDPAIGAAGSGSVEITVGVEAASLEDALSAGSVIIRTAVHAAGGHTPQWSIEWLSGRATRQTLIDA